jgi:SAM-dependent methyltransferase
MAKRHMIDCALSRIGLPIERVDVMDLACGRGGDISKVRGCMSYTGVDSAGGALTELLRRAEEVGVPATVVCCDATNAPRRPAHLMLCNFAIHYFCDSRAHCAALLDKVAQVLVPGAILCGTYERHPTREFGVPFHAIVGDCVDAMEWRVPWDEVVCMALARGLAVVYHIPLAQVDSRCNVDIWGFMMQSAQVQYCGRTQQG